MFHLTAMGNAPLDAIVKVDEGFLIKNNIEKAALTVIDAVQRDDLLHQLQEMDAKVSYIPGGGSANVASVLGALGGKAAFQGRIGAGRNGDFFIESLHKNGLETSSVYRDSDNGTALIIIPITPDGERSFASYYGAAGLFGPDNIDEKQVADSQALYVEGFGLIAKTGFAGYKKAIKVAKEAGRKVFFGVSDKTIIEDYIEEVPYLIEAADMVFMNRLEAETLSGETDMDAILKNLLGRNISGVITRGADGVYILDAQKNHAIFFAVDKPLSAAEVVNMNGAGDAFTGGFLYGLLNGTSQEKAVKLACACAREIIQTEGPRPLESLRHLL